MTQNSTTNFNNHDLPSSFPQIICDNPSGVLTILLFSNHFLAELISVDCTLCLCGLFGITVITKLHINEHL